MDTINTINIGPKSSKAGRFFANDRLTQSVGCFLVFTAAASYYFSTVVIRRASYHVSIDPAFFVFVRFLLGFGIVCAVMVIKGRKLKPKRYDLLFGRAIANGVAVYCFYTAVTHTTLAQANILNMTYPVFVALISWLLLKKQRDIITTIGSVAAFIGIYLILSRQGPFQLGWQHLWGLASGISASIAMIILSLSRMHHDTETILFYLFGFGAILTFAAFSHVIHLPGIQELYYLVLSSGFAIIGQYCITFGYRYVTAVEGGILASSRILLAAALGPFIAADPFLDLKGWIGAGLIFGVNIALAWRKSRSGSTDKAKTDRTSSPAFKISRCGSGLSRGSSTLKLPIRVNFEQRKKLKRSRLKRRL